MRLMKYISIASMAGTLSLSLVGAALADDASIDTTGPGSTQTITIDNTSKVETTNTNKVDVANVNLQDATTGDVSANKNTTVGGLESGAAANEANTSTDVNISNAAPTPGSGQGGEGAGGSGQGAGNGAGAPGGAGAGMGAGGVLSATSPASGFGAGEAVLPEVGAKFPVDVSALRANWSPRTDAAKTLAQNTNTWSVAMLAIASLLSLVGATLSYVYYRRQYRRVV